MPPAPVPPPVALESGIGVVGGGAIAVLVAVSTGVNEAVGVAVDTRGGVFVAVGVLVLVDVAVFVAVGVLVLVDVAVFVAVGAARHSTAVPCVGTVAPLNVSVPAGGNPPMPKPAPSHWITTVATKQVLAQDTVVGGLAHDALIPVVVTLQVPVMPNGQSLLVLAETMCAGTPDTEKSNANDVMSVAV
jgi:hypothetical protein